MNQYTPLPEGPGNATHAFDAYKYRHTWIETNNPKEAIFRTFQVCKRIGFNVDYHTYSFN